MPEAFVIAGHASDFPPKLRAATQHRAFTAGKVREAYEHEKGAYWLAPRAAALAPLFRGDLRSTGEHRLLLLESPSGDDREALLTQFRYVVAADRVHLIPVDELMTVLGSRHPEDLFIGWVSAASAQAVVLYPGDLRPVVVPRSWFAPTATGTKPDFDDVEVIDHGQTVRLGMYEAATDAILYELSSDYRKRLRKRRIEQDQTFGGSLRRLRLQKGFGRKDFPGISAKELARIERGEVARPHDQTLKILAKRLGVASDEIETF